MGNKQSKRQEKKVSIPPETSQTVSSSKKKLTREEKVAKANLLVFGYIRNCKLHIPTPIWHICCSYYLSFLLVFELDSKMTADDWTFLKILPRGYFGKAMQVRKKDTLKVYVMKVVKKKTLVKRKHVAYKPPYRNVISNIDHPFIVSIKFAFQSERKYYMIYDTYNASELFYNAGNGTKLACNRTKCYGGEICIALGYLHSVGIICGDLESKNIFLSNDGHIKITDFNYCKDSFDTCKSEDDADTIVHVLNNGVDYSAPEVLRKGLTVLNRAMDWWSFGMIMYKMMTGLEPRHDEIDSIIESICNGKTECCSNEARSLLLGLLQRHPSKRLGSSKRDNLEIQEHAFFCTLDFDKLYRKEYQISFKPFIDTCCCNEEPRDTVVDTTETMIQARDMFAGFTYT